MSTQNPILPTPTDLKGIDATIYDIQTYLDTALVWLTNGQGRAYKLSKVKTNDSTVFLPEVYLGGNQFKYFAATPDNDKKGQSIFVLGNETYLDYRVGRYGQKNYDVSIIFSCNLKLIDPTLLLTEDFTRHQIMDAEEALTRGLLGKAYRLVIDSCVTEFDEVYSGFDVTKEYGASLAPMSYFRFNCTVTLDEACAGVSLNRCGAITQNLTTDDKLNCILPTYDFTDVPTQDATTAQQQTDLSTWLCAVCPDVCTVIIPSLDFTTGGTDYACLSEQQVSDILNRNKVYYTKFDGINEELTTTANVTELNSTSQLTLSFWVNIPLQAAVSNSLCGNWISLNDWFGMNFTTTKLFTLVCSTSGLVYANTVAAFSFETWYHVCGVFDGTQAIAADRLKIYIDGVDEALTIVGTPPTTSSAVLRAFTVGAGGNAGGRANACIDEFNLYNSALTSSEALQIYNGGRKTPNYTGIAGGFLRYKMDTLNPVDEYGNYNGTSVNQDSTNIITEIID